MIDTTLKITVGYMTCIELYGDIPHPNVIKKFAQFFKIDAVILFDIARSIKLAKAIERINKKYKIN